MSEVKKSAKATVMSTPQLETLASSRVRYSPKTSSALPRVTSHSEVSHPVRQYRSTTTTRRTRKSTLYSAGRAAFK